MYSDCPLQRSTAASMFRRTWQSFTSICVRPWQAAARMILGSDSHTRYGALGTMAIGEGGGELVKQLLCDTYDIAYPGVVAIYLRRQAAAGCRPAGYCTGNHRRSI